VKAFVNDGRARYYGLDTVLRYRLTDRWLAEATYSYLRGEELNPTRFVRRLPPTQGFLLLRYQPSRWLSWVEGSALVAGAQDRLSGGDITDERIGASRRRVDITDFFQGGLISPFIQPGTDGRMGTADDVFGYTDRTSMRPDAACSRRCGWLIDFNGRVVGFTTKDTTDTKETP
jgi:outer membrane receptor protein involved in Fe transport